MSLETWKAEFYPLEASETEPEEALGHSLRKWEGLRAENLKRHGCVVTYGAIEELGNLDAILVIDGTSCALCHHFHQGNRVEPCQKCPLALALNGRCDGVGQPYGSWLDRSDPEPMIAALEGCVRQRKVA